MVLTFIWLVVYIPTPLKNMKVSWDDDIPNIWKVIKAYKSHVPNHQPAMICLAIRLMDSYWDIN